MLFALREPDILLGLLLGFLVGVPLRARLQQEVATWRPGRSGPGRPRLRAVGAARLRRPWTAYLDPYGAVAAAIAGVGWGPRPPDRPGSRRAGVMPLVVALGVHAALTALGLAGFAGAGGDLQALHGLDVSSILHGSVGIASYAQAFTLGFALENLACALLALVPIPPLEMGVLLWSRLPRTPGSRRVAYHLLEEPWGIVALLVLLLLPLVGEDPLLLALINSLARPLLGLL